MRCVRRQHRLKYILSGPIVLQILLAFISEAHKKGGTCTVIAAVTFCFGEIDQGRASLPLAAAGASTLQFTLRRSLRQLVPSFSDSV